MMNWISRVLVTTGVMTFVVGGAPVSAQQSPSPAVDKNAVVLIPGVLTGPGTMGPRGYRRLCTPRSVGLYEWQVRWIERVVRPTETQRAALNDLQSASSKAIATMATACKAEMPTTTKAELEMMDNRLEIMSQAVKTLRPAFDAFYASLDRKQQQRLDVFGPRLEEEKADLIVAGGYRHSRLGEWIFGGVTRELLTASPVCCLLSH